MLRRKFGWMTWISIFLIVGMILFPDLVFAKGTGEEELLKIGEIILKLLSWLRIVPAIIAGKLLTNDFVYGSFIHLDIYLWKIWTMMRVFANYTLGFLFIGYILKQFFKPGGTSEVIGVVKKTFIAGILIQMSWFLMAALIDFSIIATAAVSSLPQQVMTKQFEKMAPTLNVPKKITMDGLEKAEAENEVSEENIKSIDDISVIVPKADTVSGPLIFLGASILNLFEYSYNGGTSNTNNSEDRSLTDITLGGALKIGVLIMVVMPLIVLMVVNAYRIFWIWLWIIFSPFIILDQVFNGPIKNNSQRGEKFKMGSILGLIFQPVAVVGLLSLGLILVIGVRNTLQGGQDFEKKSLEKMNVHISGDDSATIGGGTTPEVTINGKLFKDLGHDVGGAIGQLILIFFTVFLLRALVKVGFSTSAVTKKLADGMYDFATKSMKLLPIPVPGLGKVSVGALQRGYDQNKGNIKNIVTSQQGSKAEDIMSKFAPSLYAGQVRANEAGNLKSLVNNNPYVGKGDHTQAKAFWDAAYALSEKKTQMSYTGEFKGAVDHWLNKGGLKYLKHWNVIGKNITSVSELGKDENSEDKKKVYKYIDYTMKKKFTTNPGQTSSGAENISGVNWGKKK